MFTEYKTTRMRKPIEDLISSKDFQINSRRLYLPLNPKKYGLTIREWEEDILKNGKTTKKKHHQITWKNKPYCKLLLNNDKKSKNFLILDINTERGISIQTDPSDFNRFYISIPKGAMENFPKEDTNLEYKQEGNKLSIFKK